jgi:hypothetical protein
MTPLHVFGAGVLYLAIAQDGKPDRLSFAQRFLDELNAGFLDDRQRNDGMRIKHRLLERQNADQIGGNDVLTSFLSHLYLGMRPFYQDVEFGSGRRLVGRRRNRCDDDQKTVLVRRRDAIVFHRDRQRDSFDELAVRDLFLYEGTVAQPRGLAAASADDEKPLVNDDAQTLRIGSSHFYDRDNAPLILVDEDVGIRRESSQASSNHELHQGQ